MSNLSRARLAASTVLATVLSTLLAGPAIAAPTPAFDAQRVNPDPAGDQFTSSTAMAADGHFAVAYSSSESSHSDVFVRRYSAAEVADPTAQGVDVSVTDRDQPALAMDSTGAMAVAYRYDASGAQDVRAQRLDATGNAVGPEITGLDTTANRQQIDPKVAMAPDGRFVVVWTSYTGGPPTIQARAFSAAGVPTTMSDIPVSAGTGTAPSVDMDSAGKFVVAWQEGAAPGVAGVVKARRFDAAGTPQAEFAAFTGDNSAGYFRPAVGLADDESIVVAFNGTRHIGAQTLSGLLAQRLDAADAAQGPPFEVSTTTGAGSPSLAMDPGGDFIAAYETQQGGGSQPTVRQYTADGVAQGAEVMVGTNGSPGNVSASVATDGAARMAVAWTGFDGGGGNLVGSFTRRLNYGVVPPSPQCSDGVDNDGDGRVDFPADPGCSSASDDSESPDPSSVPPAAAAPTSPPGKASFTPQCADGRDNDGDGAIDLKDPGCGTAGDNNEADESVGDLVLCGRRQISLVRADAKGPEVVLSGLVAQRLAGRAVQIFANYGARKARGARLARLATVKAGSDGQFTARVARPPTRLFNTSRFEARVGKSRSAALKLPQSLASSSVRKAGHEIEVRGAVKRSLLGKRNVVVVKRLVCGHYQTVGQVKPAKSGAYAVRFAAPRLATAALYRAQARVLAKPHAKRYVQQFARAIGITLTGQAAEPRAPSILFHHKGR